MDTTPRVETIDDYIAGFPPDVQRALSQVRHTIRSAVPGAEEAISYRIPTFRLDGRILIYFAGFRSHIGLYPVHADSPGFNPALARYASGKATLKFMLDLPLPLALIAALVKARAKAGRAAATNRKIRKPRP